MKKIISILNKPWAPVIVFVPGFNIIYLAFRIFVAVDSSGDVPVWMYSIVVIPGFLLYRFTPDEFGLAVTHLVISGFAALHIFRSRGAYTGKLATKEKILRSFLPLAICAVFLMLINSDRTVYDENVVTTQEIKEKTFEALDALVEDDIEAWNSLIHPEYGAAVKTLTRYKSTLEFDGINFDNGYSYSGQYGTHYTIYDVEDGDAMCMEAYVHIGGKRCFVRTIWQDSSNGSGFIDFLLVKK